MSALATFAASLFKGTFNVEIQVGENEPAEAAIRRFRRGVLNSGVLPEVRDGSTRRRPPQPTMTTRTRLPGPLACPCGRFARAGRHTTWPAFRAALFPTAPCARLRRSRSAACGQTSGDERAVARVVFRRNSAGRRRSKPQPPAPGLPLLYHTARVTLTLTLRRRPAGQAAAILREHAGHQEAEGVCAVQEGFQARSSVTHSVPAPHLLTSAPHVLPLYTCRPKALEISESIALGKPKTSTSAAPAPAP